MEFCMKKRNGIVKRITIKYKKINAYIYIFF